MDEAQPVAVGDGQRHRFVEGVGEAVGQGAEPVGQAGGGEVGVAEFQQGGGEHRVAALGADVAEPAQGAQQAVHGGARQTGGPHQIAHRRPAPGRRQRAQHGQCAHQRRHRLWRRRGGRSGAGG
ncbi:hypothetical protein SAZ_31675 [Streptomyces noursei ZPM]|nr:hypothetical protein SAZ_31675 [Streptomyces noursei ZPM]